MDVFEIISIIISYLSPGILAIGLIYFFSRRDKKKNVKELTKISRISLRVLTILFILTTAFLILAILEVVYVGKEVFDKYYDYVKTSIVITIIAFFLTRFFYLNRETLKEREISTYIDRILNSDSFIDQFLKSLPTGKEDKDNGFDYIPWIIRDIEKRRLRFQKSSSKYFQWLVGLGILFISLVLYFSYIILDDRGTGTYNLVSEISTDIKSLDQNLKRIDPDLSKDRDFTQFVKEFLETYPQEILESPDKEYVQLVKKELEQLQFTNDFTNINDLININIDSIGIRNSDLNTSINRLATRIDEFQKEERKSIFTIPTLIRKLDIQNKYIHSVLEADRVTDIIKRLVVSFLVLSFLIAILRYLASLHRSHYEQMMKAELESIAIRKFYIAYQTAQSNDERKIIYDKYLFNFAKVSDGEDERGDKSQQMSYELIKEALKNLSKNIS